MMITGEDKNSPGLIHGQDLEVEKTYLFRFHTSLLWPSKCKTKNQF